MRSLHPERFYGTIFRPMFSIAYTLFQVTYPVTPLLATLTKTAGCTPKIPILELTPPRPIPVVLAAQFPRSKNCPILRNFSYRASIKFRTG
jgi:hypothetical protein